MPEFKQEITRTQTITISKVEKNSYGDLLFTDSTGKGQKLSKKREQYFNLIVVGAVVLLNFSSYQGKEYISSVEKAQLEGAETIPPITSTPIVTSTPLRPPGGGDKNRDDKISERSSIEAQVAFKGLVELLCAGVVKLTDPLGQTVRNFATSKLANWSSTGSAVEVEGANERQDIPRDENAIPVEDTINNLKAIISAKKMTNRDLRDTLTELGGKGKTVTEMVESLPKEALAQLNSRLAPLVPSRLVQEAIRLGAVAEAQAGATLNKEVEQ